MIHILALAGKRKSGKTRLAEIALQDPRTVLIPFAKPLKDAYAKEFGIPRSDLDDVVKKEFHRQGMQKLSLEIKNGDPYYFIDKWEEEVDSQKDGAIVVCDDLRYIREWGRVHKKGGHVYQVWVDQSFKEKHRGFKFDPKVDLDPSETELDGFSAYDFHLCGGGRIYNNYLSVEPVEREIAFIMQHRFPIQRNVLVLA